MNWTVKRISILKKYYTAKGTRFVADKLKCEAAEVRIKANQLNLTNKNKWQNWQVAYLKKNYSKYPVTLLAKTLNKTEVLVYAKAHGLGLGKLRTKSSASLKKITAGKTVKRKVLSTYSITKKLVKDKQTAASSVKWRVKEVKYVIINYKELSLKKISVELNRPVSEIKEKVKQLGLQAK